MRSLHSIALSFASWLPELCIYPSFHQLDTEVQLLTAGDCGHGLVFAEAWRDAHISTFDRGIPSFQLLSSPHIVPNLFCSSFHLPALGDSVHHRSTTSHTVDRRRPVHPQGAASKRRSILTRLSRHVVTPVTVSASGHAHSKQAVCIQPRYAAPAYRSMRLQIVSVCPYLSHFL